MHKDGVLHEMPGSFGTFEITAQAGDFATVKWTFTGSYVEAATDDPNPSPNFERRCPARSNWRACGWPVQRPWSRSSRSTR